MMTDGWDGSTNSVVFPFGEFCLMNAIMKPRTEESKKVVATFVFKVAMT